MSRNSRWMKSTLRFARQGMPDEDDRVFYEVSLSVEDSFLITGNFKHYPQTPKVISPADFLMVMKDSKEE